MAGIDEISETLGYLRAQMEAAQRTINGIDSKVDGLGDRMVAVEQFRGRFEAVEKTVQFHGTIVQRGMGVWMVLTLLVSAGWSFAVDAVKRWMA